MTGPEHYREAEKLLHLASQGHNQGNENEDRLTAQAQVHATLALAAATAINDPDPCGTGQPDWAMKEWEAVAFPDPLDAEVGPS